MLVRAAVAHVFHPSFASHSRHSRPALVTRFATLPLRLPAHASDTVRSSLSPPLYPVSDPLPLPQNPKRTHAHAHYIIHPNHNQHPPLHAQGLTKTATVTVGSRSRHRLTRCRTRSLRTG